VALYNKYRPRNLSEVCGQDHVKEILSSQVRKDDLVHSYLFVGPAGTGKTTVARILAAMVNCASGQKVEISPDDDNVAAIFRGGTLDVMEIDAATSNGIDEVRELRERLKYAPTVMCKKVLILDECHRLSDAAWEGLLKILEEPPPYAMFVLCTTEPHKVKETIKSRCMILNFKSLPPKEIRDLLRKIAESEGIDITDDAISLLASSSQGSFRLAISSLEQLKHSGKVDPEKIKKVLGIMDRASSRDFLKAVVQRKFMDGLAISSGAVSSGIKAPDFMRGLAEVMHDLLVSIAKAYDLSVVGYTEEDKEALSSLQAEIIRRVDSRNYSEFIRGWIRVLDQAFRLSIYNLDSQFHLDYVFAELLATLRKHETTNQ
jgi:DNA polymerase-3 subunit gamma/tau